MNYDSEASGDSLSDEFDIVFQARRRADSVHLSRHLASMGQIRPLRTTLNPRNSNWESDLFEPIGQPEKDPSNEGVIPIFEGHRHKSSRTNRGRSGRRLPPAAVTVEEDIPITSEIRAQADGTMEVGRFHIAHVKCEGK
jgi:hypothetical protein